LEDLCIEGTLRIEWAFKKSGERSWSELLCLVLVTRDRPL